MSNLDFCNINRCILGIYLSKCHFLQVFTVIVVQLNILMIQYLSYLLVILLPHGCYH